MRVRLLAAGLGLVLLAAGLALGGAPRMTLVNAGLRVDHAWPHGIAALGISAGLAVLAWAAPLRPLRWAAAVAAAAAAVFALGRVVHRLDAGNAGVVDRGLLGTTRLGWREVRRVDAGPDLILLWGPGEAQVRIETTGLSPEQRAILERTIARHVREAQARPGQP